MNKQDILICRIREMRRCYATSSTKKLYIYESCKSWYCGEL